MQDQIHFSSLRHHLHPLLLCRALQQPGCLQNHCFQEGDCSVIPYFHQLRTSMLVLSTGLPLPFTTSRRTESAVKMLFGRSVLDKGIIVWWRANNIISGQQRRVGSAVGCTSRSILIGWAQYFVVGRWPIGGCIAAWPSALGAVFANQLPTAASPISTHACTRLAQQQCPLDRRQYDCDDQHQTDSAANDVRRDNDYFTQAVCIRWRYVHAGQPVWNTRNRCTVLKDRSLDTALHILLTTNMLYDLKHTELLLQYIMVCVIIIII